MKSFLTAHVLVTEQLFYRNSVVNSIAKLVQKDIWNNVKIKEDPKKIIYVPVIIKKVLDNKIFLKKIAVFILNNRIIILDSSGRCTGPSAFPNLPWLNKISIHIKFSKNEYFKINLWGPRWLRQCTLCVSNKHFSE